MNKLIVEGKNDEGFILAYKNYLNANNYNIAFQLSKLAGGLNEVSLAAELKTIKADLAKENKSNIKIGFILDKDFVTTDYTHRHIYLNNAIENVFEINPHLAEDAFKKWFNYEDLEIECSYFLMQNSNNEGELIDFLKELKLNESPIADCVINCFKQKKDYTEKEISDDWLHNLLKWDACNYTNRRNSKNFALDKYETQNNLQNIFDFKNTKLEPLKEYLNYICT